eukprot:1456089-Prymnesium_polylepis.1
MAASGPCQHTQDAITLLQDLKNAFWLPPYPVRGGPSRTDLPTRSRCGAARSARVSGCGLSRAHALRVGASWACDEPSVCVHCSQSERVRDVVEKMVALYGESTAIQNACDRHRSRTAGHHCVIFTPARLARQAVGLSSRRVANHARPSFAPRRADWPVPGCARKRGARRRWSTCWR